MKGTYVLLIEIERDIDVKIGKLGKFNLKKGCYLYIGSGKNGLEKRIKRHLRKEKKLFWHIDYLLKNPHARIKKIWTKEEEEECSLAKTIASNNTFEIPVKRFGSSDCRCKAHLFLAKEKGEIAEILKNKKFTKREDLK